MNGFVEWQEARAEARRVDSANARCIRDIDREDKSTSTEKGGAYRDARDRISMYPVQFDAS